MILLRGAHERVLTCIGSYDMRSQTAPLRTRVWGTWGNWRGSGGNH